MKNTFAMDVLKTQHNLPHDELGEVLFELPSSSDVCEQVPTTADLHDIYDMQIGLKALIKPNYVHMSGSFKYIILLHDFFERVLISHKCFIYRLQRNKFSC